MDTSEFTETLSSTSMRTAGSTLVSYALVILGMTILLFGVPWVIFSLL